VTASRRAWISCTMAPLAADVPTAMEAQQSVSISLHSVVYV
jgi:hypothetical protein